MSKVSKIIAYETLHAGGSPTITAKMTLDNGREVESSVSTGEHVYPYQNKQLLDNDPERYQGLGVLRAVHYINNLIAPKLTGVSPTKQNEVDGWLLAADGTADRSKLGVTTLFAISSLFAKAAAVEAGAPIYKYINAIYNARHPETAVKMEKVSSPIVPVISSRDFGESVDFEEFCIAPSSSYAFSKSLEISMRVYMATLRNIKTANFVGNTDVMETITKATELLNLRLASDVFLAVNFGASSYNRGSTYVVKDKPQPLKKDDYIEFVSGLIKKFFPLFLIDPILPDDPGGWNQLAQTISNDAYIVGDDLIGSNPKRLTQVLTDKTCSSYLLKPSEVGTITEVFEMVNLSRKHSLNYIFSTSKSETNDSMLADLSVGLGADFVKLGNPTEGENFSKYNRMVEIENQILNIKPV